MTDPCKDCGLCCKTMIIEIDHVDVIREPKLLPVVMLLDGDGLVEYDSEWEKQYRLACGARYPCKLLDEGNRCTIYSTRPNCCVMFEVGGERCQELREDYGLLPIVSQL